MDCTVDEPRWATNTSWVFSAPRGFEETETGSSLYERGVSETGEEYEREIGRLESGYFAPGTFAALEALQIDHHLERGTRILAGASEDEQTGDVTWTYVIQLGDASIVLTTTFEVDVAEFLRCFYVPGKPDPAFEG